MLFFIHIPKTAGSTWRSILYRQYGDGKVCPVYDGDGWYYSVREVRRMAAARRNSYEAMLGHIGLERVDLMANAAHVAISTLLRHPVSRGESLIRHLQANDPAYRGKSPHEVLDSGNPQFDNHQVRMLCSTPPREGRAGAPELDSAVRALEGFAHFGLSERFQETYALACLQLGWRPVAYQRRNVGVDPGGRDTQASGVRERLAELNGIDMQLYEEAKRLFEDRIAYQMRSNAGRWSARLAQVARFEGTPVELQAQGGIGQAGQGILRGWARLPGFDHPAIVQCLWNGQVMVEAEARDPRPALAAKGIEPGGRCGFTLDVARAMRSRGLPAQGIEVEVTVRQSPRSRLKYRGSLGIPL